jgi:hypothetical protein
MTVVNCRNEWSIKEEERPNKEKSFLFIVYRTITHTNNDLYPYQMREENEHRNIV